MVANYKNWNKCNVNTLKKKKKKIWIKIQFQRNA